MNPANDGGILRRPHVWTKRADGSMGYEPDDSGSNQGNGPHFDEPIDDEIANGPGGRKSPGSGKQLSPDPVLISDEPQTVSNLTLPSNVILSGSTIL